MIKGMKKKYSQTAFDKKKLENFVKSCGLFWPNTFFFENFSNKTTKKSNFHLTTPQQKIERKTQRKAIKN